MQTRKLGRLVRSLLPKALWIFFIFLFPSPSFAQAPAPPTNLQAKDTPSDAGKSITITWQKSADDGAGANTVVSYEILRAAAPESAFASAGTVPAGKEQFVDNGVENRRPYVYKIKAQTAGGTAGESLVSSPVAAKPQWWNSTPDYNRIFVGMVFVVGFILYNIRKAGKKELYIRPIAGINAIDEGIGRATEMGRPILFVCGLGTAADAATIAAFSVLGRVSQKVAQYQSKLIVPCYDPIVFTVCQDVVKGAYSNAGRPEAYNEKDVFFVTQDQFPYVAAVNGIMLREKPATNFYLGQFYAESLILAETGFQAGSIQIAGTDQLIQMAFFIVACDFTLIGEELYAASAYLSKEPEQVGSIKGQDWGKVVFTTLSLLGVISVFLESKIHLFVWFRKLFMAQ